MHENYRGIPVESESEIMILDWLFELQQKGFIHSIERAPELVISRGLVNKWVKRTEMKTKVKEESKEQVLLNNHHYTPEFEVQWYPHTPSKLVWPIASIGLSPCVAPLIGHSFPVIAPSEEDMDKKVNGLMTYIEVKPSFDFQNKTSAFKVNQKWVWESRKMFINLLQPLKLYKDTFTPLAYMTTRKKKTERDIKWEIRTVDQYLEILNPSRNDSTIQQRDSSVSALEE